MRVDRAKVVCQDSGQKQLQAFPHKRGNIIMKSLIIMRKFYELQIFNYRTSFNCNTPPNDVQTNKGGNHIKRKLNIN